MSLLFDTLPELAFSLPKNHERRWISGGVIGTADTITEMQKLVTTGKRHQRIRELAGQLVSACPKKDYYCYAKAIFDFCQTKIQYAFDPTGVEWVEHPVRILDAKIADCDSICILFSSLCETIGLPCRYVTIKADTGRPDEYSHVFCEVKIPKRGWIGADATMPYAFGWEPESTFPRTNWAASKDAPDFGDEPDTHENDKMAGVSGMNGMRDFSDEANILPQGDVEVEDSAFCSTCPTLKYEGPEQDFFFAKRPEQRQMMGMGHFSDLGAQANLSVGQIANIIQSMLNGNEAGDLHSQKVRADENLVYTYQVLMSAQNGSQEEKARLLPAASSTYQAALDQKHRVQDAIQKYADAASTIRTWSANQLQPPGLAGMGEAVTWTVVALAGVVAVGSAVSLYFYSKRNADNGDGAVASKVSALTDLVNALHSAGVGGDAIAHITGLIAPNSSAGGSFTGSIGTVLLVGVVGYVAFLAAKKKGLV